MDFGGRFAGAAGIATAQVYLGSGDKRSLRLGKYEVKEVTEVKDTERNGSGCSDDRNRSQESGGAFERGDGLVCEHGDGARTAWRGEHRVAARQLRPAHPGARTARVR